MTIHQKSSLNKTTILLVEENEEHITAFLQLANKNGWEVNTCDGSMQAIKYLKTNAIPDVMVIDRKASPMDALQTYDYIQSELKITLPVLISSKLSSISKVDNDDHIGFLLKPFSDETPQTIESFLNGIAPHKNIEEKMYSLNYLNNLSDGNMEFIFTSLNIFSESVRTKLEEITLSLTEKNFDVVREIAHNIKPSFEMLENKIGSAICNDLVYKTPEGEMNDKVAKLQQLFSAMDLQLKKDFPKIVEA